MAGQDYNDKYFTVYIFYLIITLITTISFSIVLLIVLKKVRRYLDDASIVILFTFEACISLRFVNSIIYVVGAEPQIIGYTSIVLSALTLLVWFILYYFVFELQSVKDLLTSGKHSDYLKKNKVTKKKRSVILLVILCLFITILIITGYKTVTNNIKEDVNSTISIISLIARLIRFPLDFYMFSLFLRLFWFFVEEKRAKL